MGVKVTNLKIELQSGTTDTLYASWGIADKHKNNVDHYAVTWKYATGDGVYFDGSSSNETSKVSTYTPPTHATTVRVYVKPVAKKTTKNGKSVSKFTGEKTSEKYSMSKNPPGKMSTPTASITGLTLTATLENIDDANAEYIEFRVYKDTDTEPFYKSGKVKVVTKRASCSVDVVAGGKYRVCCRGCNEVGKSTEWGEWSDYTSEMSTVPTEVSDIKCEVDSDNIITLSWTAGVAATSYEIEYTTNELYFDSSTEVQSMTVESTTAYLTGLDSGYTYYVRIRAVNSEGTSGWVKASQYIASIITGTKPSPPTTWTNTTTAKVGEAVTFYWTHNSTDESKMTSATIRYIIGGVSTEVVVDASTFDKDTDIFSYTLDTSSISDGSEILWDIKTKGIIDEYSDWSIQRSVKIYAPATLSLTMNEELTAFPHNITINAGPSTQKALKFHVQIVATESYDSEDDIGNTIRISEGDELYSNVFLVSSNTYTLQLTPSMITLEHGQTYKVNVTSAMNSGLTAEATDEFEVTWTEEEYDPDAEVTVDTDSLYATILPFCTDDNGDYISGVTLAVYRREYDGTFTLIQDNVANNGYTTVTDPHPALDYARYRIIAKSTTNGSMGYTDLVGVPVDEPSIVIQWAEQWSDFDYAEIAAPETPSWTGSMIKLPYNVDVSESRDLDVSLIEYIGRSHPVSYYGTQRGETASWSTEVPKTDKETIYALRRLAVWRGDVYVREPSGTGYWAQVSVSISSKHKELTIPVTFDITRVEGGA